MRRQARRWRQSGIRVGFVPTMGCLHEGHLSLIERARKAVGACGKVVASVYVNPAQFGPFEDYSRYPRDLERDISLTRAAGVDVLFVPDDREMYPTNGDGSFSTYVIEDSVAAGMEGASRPHHFRGVTTVVAKLFNIVLPDIAIFGRKDYQQTAVVRRMVRDLDFPIRVIVGPTVRERDGLAMSSRNRYLSVQERERAPAMFETIRLAREVVRKASAPLSAGQLRRRLIQFLGGQPGVRVDYVAFFDPDSLRVVQRVRRGTHLALAAFFGKTRLIDNGRL